METCNSCNIELTEDNWSESWKDIGRTQCKSCSQQYNNYSNKRRMYINGKYISQNNPLWKPGRYKSLDDAWSHEQIERTSEGEVYAIVNPAFPDWIKVGKAVNADDRCNGYQTSSPFRDYSIIARLTTDNRHEKEAEMHRIFTHFSEDRKGEWFKIDKLKAIKIFNHQAKTFFQQLSKGLEDAA